MDEEARAAVDEMRRGFAAMLEQLTEGLRVNAQAIERLRAEMNERFRENEIIVGAAFRQIRLGIEELGR